MDEEMIESALVMSIQKEILKEIDDPLESIQQFEFVETIDLKSIKNGACEAGDESEIKHKLMGSENVEAVTNNEHRNKRRHQKILNKLDKTNNVENVCKPKKRKNELCKVCSKTFSSRTLKLHMRTHSNDWRPFKCEECPKSFRLPQFLEKHKLTHTYRRFSCEKCLKSFSYLQVLERHMTLHSNELLYRCEICAKAFRLQVYLQEHLRIHSDERNFMCEICSKRFRHSKTLKMHKITHTDVRNFMCEHCSKRFRDRRTLLLHIALHTS